MLRDWWDLFKIGMWGLLLLFAFVVVIEVFGNALGLASLRFWAPKREEARREVFENSTAYVHGKKQRLVNLHMEWSRAETTNGKGAICATARHEASTLDPKYIPDHLTTWECIR